MRFSALFTVAHATLVVLWVAVSGCRLQFPQVTNGDASTDAQADSAPPDGPLHPDADLFDAAVDAVQQQDGSFVDGTVDAQGPACGNGTQDPGEECDDGNKLSHDGCSSGCTSEVPTWHKLSLADSPSVRWGSSLAYDTDRRVVVLFGGTNGGEHDDTWEFDGATWTQTVVASAPHPSPRRGAAMAYFPALGHVVLFGGFDGSQRFQDTWVYADGVWMLLSLPTAPPPREFPMMVYESAENRVLLYGGRGTTSNLNDQWFFDGSSWQRLDVSPIPPGRVGPAAAYDTARSATILFGGLGAGMKQDTWEFDGSLWTEISGPAHPGPRYWAAMAYDPRIHRSILFGGEDPDDNFLADTWEFDGTTWHLVFPAGEPMAGISRLSMVYNVELASIVMFGGLKPGRAQNDTWTYRWESDWPEEDCSSGLDDDNDGLADCADPDCEGRRCTGGVCRNGTCQ